MNGKYLDADWYRVKYNLAAQSLNYARALGDEERAEPHREKAERHARELVLAGAETLAAVRRRRMRKAHAGLRRFLEETGEPAAALLYAGATLETRAVGTRGAEIADRDGLAAAVAEGGGGPGRIVAYVVSLKPVGYRVDYNLACYLATLSKLIAGPDPHAGEIREWADPEPAADADAEERAFAALTLAIERAPAAKSRELLEWARHDPALAPVARHERFKTFLSSKSPVERFKHLLTEERPEGFGAAATTGYRPEEDDGADGPARG